MTSMTSHSTWPTQRSARAATNESHNSSAAGCTAFADEGGAGPMATNSHPLALRVPPLALTFVAGVGAWLCARAMPALRVETSLQLPVAVAFAVLGSAFSLLGVISFRQARTTVNPTTPGAATALVVSGVYRVTRNPMYLGFLCFLLGELVWLGNPVALLTAPAFVIYLNRFQIAPEECALRARFGAEFNTYTTRVRRWL